MNKSSRTIDLIIFCLLAVYAVCLSCMHAIRLPFNCFWIDTAFSVDLIRLPVGEMLSATAVNEHPPFYYLFGKAVVTLLGDKPWAFRATGFIPYIGILILFCLIHKKNVLYCFVCSIAAVISYLPWLGVMLRNFGVRADDWWAADYSGFDESMSEIFGLKRFYYPAMMIIAILVIYAFLQYRNARKNSDKTATSSAAGFIWFVLTGILVIGLVMTVGIVVSELVRPLFLSRYIYPLSSIGWLLFGIGLDRLGKILSGLFDPKKSKVLNKISKYIPATISVLLAILAINTFYGVYRDNVNIQRYLSDGTNSFLEQVTVPSGSVIYSDFEKEEFTIAGCYFPGTDVYMQNASFFYDIPEFDEFYLVWQDGDVEVSCENLNSYGFETELLASGGALGVQTNVSVVYCKKK